MGRAEVKTVKTARFEMVYTVFGSGKKSFVLLPGVSMKPVSLSAEAVAGQYRDFCEDYTVYMFDRVNSIGEVYSTEDMAEDTAEAMAALGLRDAYIVGVSQGGMMLQRIAARHPELVHCGILASTACRGSAALCPSLKRWAELARSGDGEKTSLSMFAELYSDEYLEKYKDVFAHLARQGTAEELRRLAVLLEACLDFENYEGLDAIRCPMLVIGAENDSVFPPEPFSREMAERLGCEMQIVPHYRHAAYDEEAGYRERIRRFFEAT